MAKKKPLKLRELLNRLKKYGIINLPGNRGKGSEIILLKPNSNDPDSPQYKKGPQYPVKNHGMGNEISAPVINAICRRFGITDFWD